MKVELDDVLAFIEFYKNEQTVSKYAKANECREVRAAFERLSYLLKIKFENEEN